MVIVCARARKNGQKCRPTLLSLVLSPPSAIDSPTGQAVKGAPALTELLSSSVRVQGCETPPPSVWLLFFLDYLKKLNFFLVNNDSYLSIVSPFFSISGNRRMVKFRFLLVLCSEVPS